MVIWDGNTGEIWAKYLWVLFAIIITVCMFIIISKYLIFKKNRPLTGSKE